MNGFNIGLTGRIYLGSSDVSICTLLIRTGRSQVQPLSLGVRLPTWQSSVTLSYIESFVREIAVDKWK